MLKIKDLRKIKNRIKIIVVLANQKARFFYFRGVLFEYKGVKISRGVNLIDAKIEMKKSWRIFEFSSLLEVKE